MIHTLIFGAGRMARSMLLLVSEFPAIKPIAIVSPVAPDWKNTETVVPFFTSLEAAHAALESKPDLVIDFSLNSGTPIAAKWCADHGVALLSGVTGIDKATDELLDQAAGKAPVLWAPNLSFGVNLLAGLLRQAAPLVGSETGIVIEETHHAGKKDAPSGTALHLAKQFSDDNEISFVSHREGDVVGVHEVRLSFQDESLTFRHRAGQRRLFARGALQAGQWLVTQKPGRYSASDWISSVIEERDRGANGQA